MNDLIMATNWDLVEEDNFYLTKDWEENGGKENVEEARKLQKERNLFYGYIVEAKNYAIYNQMDSTEIFINEDGERILTGESQVIDSDYKHREEFNW